MMLPDLRKIEPELLEDDILCALQDSMDMDWTCTDGAHAVMRMLFAIADTRPQGGDAQQAPLASGGGAEGNRTRNAA